jgi:two-component system, OmpR family, alkaline phosphatase synthesis response regulator PhoP
VKAVPTILVVDDEPQIVELLRGYLEREGFGVTEAGDGEAALREHERLRPDLVILDLMMPRLDGREVCRRIRERAPTPIIMLTARDEESDKLLGLELGADDYVTKPFSPREVVARVRAVLRRGRRETENVLRFGEISIDLQGHQVTVAGRPIDLTPTEFRLLETLATHPNQVFTRMQLIDRMQGHAFEGYERTVDAHVRNLRGKVERDPTEPHLIVTVYGVGYKLQVPKEDCRRRAAHAS